MAEPCTCPEGRTLVEIEGEYFCEYIDSINPSCTITTCPEGYELIDNYCQIATQGLDLCPEGYTYDPQLKTCTLIETVEATCVCTANVLASPQTICSGSTTNIVLTSEATGIAYTWTAVQSGVTGATSGNSSIIAQTLVGLGTVTYTITPFEISSQCQGEPLQVIVTVNAVPDIAVTPSSPQAISSGDTTNIVISSGVSGTTFSWTVLQETGVTGASSGTGTVIGDTISATQSGSATYTILATAPNGCTATTTFVVQVSAPILACLNSFMIDVNTIDSGCSGHGCSSATFNLIANGVNLGFAYLSNAGGPSDMGDAGSVPNLNIDPNTGLPGSSGSRYNRFTLTPAQVTAIAGTTTSGVVTFSLACDLTTGWNNYSGPNTCHTNAANMSIYVGGNPAPVYNACPNGNSITINVCTGQIV